MDHTKRDGIRYSQDKEQKDNRQTNNWQRVNIYMADTQKMRLTERAR